jgi:hypothetical protein
MHSERAGNRASAFTFLPLKFVQNYMIFEDKEKTNRKGENGEEGSQKEVIAKLIPPLGLIPRNPLARGRLCAKIDPQFGSFPILGRIFPPAVSGLRRK